MSTKATKIYKKLQEEVIRLKRGKFSEIQKQSGDIPEVEAAIALIEPLARAHWRELARELEDQLLIRLDDEEGIPEGNQGPHLEDILLAILGAIGFAARRPLSAPRTRAVLASGRGLLEDGAAARGAVAALTLAGAPGRPGEALSDLQTLLQGRVQGRLPEIRGHVRQYLTSRAARTGAGHEIWLQGLRDIIGADGSWISAVVDMWAYRQFNLGSFLALEEAGVKRIIAFNNPPFGPDDRTTPFCRRIHGRTIGIGRVRRQVAAFRDAIRRQDAGAQRRAWPLLDLGKIKSEDFDDEFLNVGLPPYHWRCRTQIQEG